eukprot:PhM_4_TR10335/c0_g1_i2/m.75969
MRTINVSVTVRVLVTDATSFVPVCTIRTLLEEGFTIAAVVHERSEQCNVLLELGRKHENRLELHFLDICSDVSVLQQLLSEVDCVIHAARPEGFTCDRAVAALRNVMAACTIHERVRKFILTSSFCALHEVPDEDHGVYGAEDWNMVSTASSAPDHYTETHCELQFFDWAPSMLPVLCEYISIVRGAVFGPSPNPKTHLTWEMKLLASLVEGSWRRVPNVAFGVVDVRDVAKAHMMAILQSSLPSKRYLVINQTVHFRDICAMVYHDVQRYCPTIPRSTMWATTTKLMTKSLISGPFALCLPRREATPNLNVLPAVCGFHSGRHPLYDATASRSDLHVTYHALTATFVDTVINLAEMGYIVDKSGPPPKEDEGDYYYMFS